MFFLEANDRLIFLAENEESITLLLKEIYLYPKRDIFKQRADNGIKRLSFGVKKVPFTKQTSKSGNITQTANIVDRISSIGEPDETDSTLLHLGDDDKIAENKKQRTIIVTGMNLGRTDRRLKIFKKILNSASNGNDDVKIVFVIDLESLSNKEITDLQIFESSYKEKFELVNGYTQFSLVSAYSCFIIISR
jgi:hypothetical protein